METWQPFVDQCISYIVFHLLLQSVSQEGAVTIQSKKRKIIIKKVSCKRGKGKVQFGNPLSLLEFLFNVCEFLSSLS